MILIFSLTSELGFVCFGSLPNQSSKSWGAKKKEEVSFHDFFKLSKEGPKASFLPFKGLHLNKDLSIKWNTAKPNKNSKKTGKQKKSLIIWKGTTYSSRRLTGRRLEKNVSFIQAMRNSKFNFCLRHSSINNAKKISGSISLYGQKLSQAVTRERTKSVMNTKIQISSAEQKVHPLINRFKEGKHCFTSTQNTATLLHTAKYICYPEHRCVWAFLPCLNSG